ncbi:MAG: ectoine/hydroxyectoine ABC transporter substrate-binding protein EhuB [Bifidobacterium tibiigranuli]|uniref:ectoine/hydroxyectoine ABC transporter substrate-binding protein EhuB n=1 Tax=Bifidobacterium tibiigranuli TaxID=2172043 RepID=UPI0026ED6336|nr:ectoine/hydroxyectoine ABC transporter substrate-binding protein EhuB [Bifidobacterium tibiigranuli]MCI1672891.1 ectoine/hydroxyectoine ABC transporter substrate-binding protein EhuB [Bifidobacterium tibiigranuli]MCI1713730.1 ectoine/hydroxyectoine ABC transporter substrate-binding protein EhuB [Bifidobacterium tibiigranuli]MCI1833978.1 ectoine/hydroxyectoine ABC transporter substrate-binding protein EhuB [Bifidobacterium tibiigranuli]
MIRTTKISKRMMTAGAVAISCLIVFAGCGSSSSNGSGASSSGGLSVESAEKKGYLNIAIGNEPPYTKLSDDGTVTGAEPDVVRAVAKSMGIKSVKGTVSSYDGMIPGLNANRWDVVAAGLFMKQSRCSQVIYTSPVVVSTEAFAVKAGNPKQLTTIAAIQKNPSLKVAVLNGGFEEGILKTKNIPDSQKVVVKDPTSGLETVTSGRADAFLLPELSLKNLTLPSGLEVTAKIEDAPKTGSGAAFSKKNAAFAKEYNTALEKFKKTDEFKKILDKWGFDADAARSATVEELCKVEG